MKRTETMYGIVSKKTGNLTNHFSLDGPANSRMVREYYGTQFRPIELTVTYDDGKPAKPSAKKSAAARVKKKGE